MMFDDYNDDDYVMTHQHIGTVTVQRELLRPSSRLLILKMDLKINRLDPGQKYDIHVLYV